MSNETKKPQPKRREKKHIVEGIVHIKATFNNTLITITDSQGNPIAWSSSAKAGFKGSRKSTPFAAQSAADELAKDCVERFGLKQVHVKINGIGPGRESAIRGLEGKEENKKLKILSIKDVTGIPHNGCRDPKKRRV